MTVYRMSLALLALGGCIEDEPRRDAVTDTGAAVDVAACSAEAKECVSAATSRACEGGQWVEHACADDESCSRINGACSKGKLSCLGTLVCNVDCGEGDKECPNTCQAQATVQAFDALGVLNRCQCERDCWPILCGRLFPWPSYGEISACVVESCAAEAATCAGGGATGDGTCEDIRTCVLECRGDVFCAEACFGQGTDEAQTTAAFYYLCVRDECGPDPAGQCLFNAQQNRCADLWTACQGKDK